MKIKFKPILFLLIICLSLTGCSTQLNTGKSYEAADGLSIHIIDVGQGESILLECNNSYMLIDAGEAEYGTTVADYLEQYNVDKLEYVVISHPHSDHYGGIEAVLKSVETENIIMTDAYSTTNSWESLVDYIDENNYNIISPKTNDVFNIGECTVTAYVPWIDNDELNNCSIVIKAEYDEMSALFTADAMKAEELAMLESDFNVKADVLKVGHHGSKTSTSETFVEEVKPQLALISCGKNNDYNHPHKETISLLNKSNVKLMRTDEQGSIIVNLYDGIINAAAANGDAEKIVINKDVATNSILVEYIGNKNSKIYHSSSCASVNKMSDENKVVFSSVLEAEQNGYTPCKKCNP